MKGHYALVLIKATKVNHRMRKQTTNFVNGGKRFTIELALHPKNVGGESFLLRWEDFFTCLAV